MDTLDAVQECSSAFLANWQLNPEVGSDSGSVILARPIGGSEFFHWEARDTCLSHFL